jgi:hypothetical protein
MSNKLVKASLLQNKKFLEKNRIGYFGMPPYEQNSLPIPFEVNLELKTEQDTKDLIEILGKDFEPIMSPSKVTRKFYWYPLLERGEMNTSLKYIWIEE